MSGQQQISGGSDYVQRSKRHFLSIAGHSDEEIDRDMALAYMGLKPTTSGGKLADSADPMWLDRESPPPTAPIVSHDTGAPSNGQVRESFHPTRPAMTARAGRFSTSFC